MKFRPIVPALVVLAACAAAPATAAWLEDPTVNLPVCTESGSQGSTRCLTDGHGGFYVMWADARNAASGLDIYVHHVLSTGVLDAGWPAAGLLACNASGTQVPQSLVTDGSDGMLALWADQRSAGSQSNYAHHVLANGTLDPAWPTNGVNTCTSTGLHYPANGLPDGTGGLFLVFGDLRSSSNNIFAQHMTSAGAPATGWAATGQLVCAASGEQYFPYFAPDGAGGLIVAWEDDRTDTGDIYGEHVLPSGLLDPAWAPQGAALCVQPGTQAGVRAASDDAGGAYFAWLDSRGTNGVDVYALHVLATGADATWLTNGAAVCTAAGDAVLLRAAADGQGGLLAAWSDPRSGDRDVYVARVMADGTLAPGWPVDGVAACTATGDQTVGDLAPDGSGGAFVCWTDSRHGSANNDIYAQHVRADGSLDPVWPPDGKAVSTSTGAQGSPAMALDGTGGVLLAWSDGRNGSTNSDVYAQRVGPNGTLAVPTAPAPAAGALLGTPFPCPASRDVAFALAPSGPTRVSVLDLTGRRVRTLAFGAAHDVARDAHWDLHDDSGRRVPPGIYFLRAASMDRSESRRLVVVN